MKVTPIAITKPLIQIDGKEPTADELMAYVARVSNPKNQGNLDTMPKLLGYCANHKHWSVFEQADLTVEIQTSRAIAQQILRHRSFTFQEFSQRYAEALDFELYEARGQDSKNRQNSLDNMEPKTKEYFAAVQQEVWEKSYALYNVLLASGVAKECARFILPLNTATTIYMKGNVRSWIHYIDLRTMPGVQKEHRDIAVAIKGVFKEYYPLTTEAIGW
jgi:thymidylate synthase (FAD)